MVRRTERQSATGCRNSERTLPRLNQRCRLTMLLLLPVIRADLTHAHRTQVWLASERTLLSWFRVALLLSSFALALFNSASDQDWASRTMGVIYAVIACAMLGYAWTMHRIRRYRIVMRYGGHHGALRSWCRDSRDLPYVSGLTRVRGAVPPATTNNKTPTDEPYGPLVVCGLIFVAVLLNFILRIKNRYVCVSLSSFWFLSLSPSLSPAGDGRQSSSSFRPLAAFFSFASRGSLVCAVRRRNSKKEDTRKSKTDQGTAYRYCREQLRDQPSPKNPWLTSVEMVKVAFNLQEPASPL